MLILSLLGTLSIADETGTVPPAARQKRPLGLLALLALGGRQAMSRHRIEAYLWPESSAPRARHALDQAIYAIRRSLGSEVVLSTGPDLSLNPALIRVDAWDFADAVRERQWAAAADLYTGPLLDGFQCGDSRELEAWIESERAQMLREYRTAVEWLADRSAEAGDHSRAAAWSRKLAASDPLSASATKRLMLAMVAGGDRAGAVQHAREYQELVRRELDIEPDAEIEAIVASLGRPSATESGCRPSPATHPDGPVLTMENRSSGHTVPREPPRARVGVVRSHIGSLASVAVIAALVIGAITVRNGLARDSLAGLPDDAAAVRAIHPSAAARDAYLRGLSALDDRTKEGHDDAIGFFRRATEVYPAYAEAYAGLAEAYVRLGYFGYRPGEGMFRKAKAAALRSIQLDSSLASARTVLATVLVSEHDFGGAEAQYRRAIALDPSDATAHQWYGVLLMILRRMPEAVASEKRAADLEPLSLQIQNNYATFVNIAGDGPGALRHFQQTVRDEPDSVWVGRNPWLLANMARVYADNGLYAEAVLMMDRAITIVPRSPRAMHTLAAIHLAGGRPDLALQVFARADSLHEHYPAYRGLLDAGRGLPDSAFLWFDRQREWGIQPMLSLQTERQLNGVRSDARFRALLQRLRIPDSSRELDLR